MSPYSGFDKYFSFVPSFVQTVDSVSIAAYCTRSVVVTRFAVLQQNPRITIGMVTIMVFFSLFV